MRAERNGPEDFAVRFRRLQFPAGAGGDAGGGAGAHWASGDWRRTSKVEVPNIAGLAARRCLRCESIANRVSSAPCARCTTGKTQPWDLPQNRNKLNQ